MIMRERLEKMPVAQELPGFKLFSPGTWGGLVVEYIDCAEKLDLGPMFEGLPDDLCPSPHWGYMLKGAMYLKYLDGSEELFSQGEAFYAPEGHTGWIEAGSKMILFSPEAEWKQIAEHLAKKMQG
jgi:hypothetical protein